MTCKLFEEDDSRIRKKIERDSKYMDVHTPISSPMKTCLHSEKSRDEITSDFTLLIKHQNHHYVAWFALTRRFFKEDQSRRWSNRRGDRKSIWMHAPRSHDLWKRVYIAWKVGMNSCVISHSSLNIQIISMLLDLHWPVGSLRRISQEDEI